MQGAKWAVSLLLAGLICSGCATNKPKPVAMTGNLLVDGPNQARNGLPKDRVLWDYRTASAALRHGQPALARQMLDDALLSIGGIIANDKNAKQARGYFHAESKKTFLGEPYERCMAYIYRGILYWMDGEPDNARACFRSAEFEDSDTENHAYSGDWVLPDYLDGWITTRLAGDGSDAFKRANASAKGVKLPPYNPKANVFFFLEFGPGPIKYGAGEYGEELKFHVPPSPVAQAQIIVDNFDFPIAPTDDVGFQATTRGGRVMDHILGNKAVFKKTTDVAGDVALIGGLGTAALSRDRTAQEVGLGVALAGLVSKVVSAATTPEADTRMWDNLPHYISFASLALSPGQHTATIEFRDAGNHPVPGGVKTVTFTVPEGHDKVIFVSDHSSTPQSI